MNTIRVIAFLVLAIAVGTFLAASEHATNRSAGENSEAAQ